MTRLLERRKVERALELFGERGAFDLEARLSERRLRRRERRRPESSMVTVSASLLCTKRTSRASGSARLVAGVGAPAAAPACRRAASGASDTMSASAWGRMRYVDRLRSSGS